MAEELPKELRVLGDKKKLDEIREKAEALGLYSECISPIGRYTDKEIAVDFNSREL